MNNLLVLCYNYTHIVNCVYLRMCQVIFTCYFLLELNFVFTAAVNNTLYSTLVIQLFIGDMVMALNKVWSVTFFI